MFSITDYSSATKESVCDDFVEELRGRAILMGGDGVTKKLSEIGIEWREDKELLGKYGFVGYYFTVDLEDVMMIKLISDTLQLHDGEFKFKPVLVILYTGEV